MLRNQLKCPLLMSTGKAASLPQKEALEKWRITEVGSGLARQYLTRLKSFAFDRGARKLTGDNLKPVWAEFSTISQAVLMMCTYSSTRTHAHVCSWKLGPGFVLLAEVCPCFDKHLSLLGLFVGNNEIKFFNVDDSSLWPPSASRTTRRGRKPWTCSTSCRVS
jgi:hypothetical protein